jgi:acyl-CoA thioesterase YciA
MVNFLAGGRQFDAYRTRSRCTARLSRRYALTFSASNVKAPLLRRKTMNPYGDPAIRITLLPRDTNPQGTIFGGIILSYIDIAGAVEAHRHTGIERFVTVAMREVVFHEPVFVGDLVSFYARTKRIGTTSITVDVVVEAERYGGTSERIKVTEAEVIYVAVDENRRKMKIVAREA